MRISAWLRRARQTRTPVHSAQSERESRENSLLAAYRTLAVLQLSAQLLLWVTLYAFDQAVQAVWQAAALLLIPLLGLWALWRAAMPSTGRGGGASGAALRGGAGQGENAIGASRRGGAMGAVPRGGAGRGEEASGAARGWGAVGAALRRDASGVEQRGGAPDTRGHAGLPPRPSALRVAHSTPDACEPVVIPRTRAASCILLALLPCLLADAVLLLHVLSTLMAELIPSYPRELSVGVAAVLCLFTVFLSGENGVAYGANTFRHWLLLLFLLSSVLLNADARPARLYPLLGNGLGSTALAALSGVGGLWGVALLFVLPTRAGTPGGAGARGMSPVARLLWTLLPWALCLIWALWYGMACPWRPGDALSTGGRLLGLARHSRSILLSELSGVMWLLLLPLSLCGCLMGGQRLLCEAAPKCPRPLAAFLLLLPAAVLCLLFPEGLLSALMPLLPWRAALSALCALGLIAFRGRGASRAGGKARRGGLKA